MEGRGAAPSFSGVLSPAVRKNPENPCCPGPPPQHPHGKGQASGAFQSVKIFNRMKYNRGKWSFPGARSRVIIWGGVRCLPCSCDISFLEQRWGDMVLVHSFWFG